MNDADLMIFGIEVLNCEDYSVAEESIQYDNVTFLISSLSKYDGMAVEVLHDWTLRVWDIDNQVIDTFFLIENDEFREKLYGMYPLGDKN
ncbi:hypothetical protein ASD24_24495 [Paenibacillus sp. Root52]|uniref:hypothetical protein n=1 Tax=Paenibacillus sp. Root52 TaxID=1736552 RepID=UPI000701A648|nr:hypothetical protein [Paenibacillus sp. Root52]KQY90959.1 hypothetical protein ASD24_24495 [Paenibacillus sp. Root52]